MTYKHLVGLCALFLCCLKSTAQIDSVYQLQEVIVSDARLKNASKTQTTKIIDQETILNQVGSFTQLLNGQSGLYFKENGAGMVSSVSFRGTSAQQTAVVWNGININSQLNGQTDFNTLSSADFSNITIKSGGGSVLYGSGAVGGSIHLQNNASFNEKSNFLSRFHLGSFNSQSGYFRWNYGTKKWAYNISLNRNQSDNDYPFLKTNLKNENGKYYNQSLNTTIRCTINKTQTLSFYSQFYDSQRDFSNSLGVRSFNQYIDWNTRNMLEWTRKKEKLEQRLKVAFLTEKYLFYENKYATAYNFGQSETFLLRQENSYRFSKKTTWIAQLELQNTTGKGSNFQESERKNNLYKTPLLYSIAGRWQANKNWALKGNFSKNYRMPTFNDLYWQGSGNTNLKPETALQYEIGPAFETPKVQFSLQYFAIRLTDLLRWIPQSSGLWTPENTAKVNSQGVETMATFETKFAAHLFKFHTNYTYTKSINEKTNKQLIYVPFHKASAQVDYQFKKISGWLQAIYQGSVFTSSDNFYALPAYSLLNFGAAYQFQTPKIKYRLGLQSQNLANENYQNVIARPMPGRNYQIILTLNL